MDIDEVIKLISNAKEENFQKTKHFKIRYKCRNKKLPEESEFINILLTKKPVGILKQGVDKFKVYYELDEEYDMIVILSIKNTNPLKINLITVFPSKRSRRERDDDNK
ncbi:hypothetical protein [Methanotorris igneus]|uniref:Phage-Barnase-EndoU-ColicinE5/D-RelE like nuclease 3 domain-containing protein n=1 Tax=Methanotorris igneus (strain DSM 5666 / JCM 11834 / Kol 5) TaxID=880724 RepID=F6BCX4_METIK|nr:hypothetical protein [Methanotorris igneus]AEF96335.1 hypothetical protein Metig_0790 [Methanotorris igneus Kol 5]